MKVEIVANFRVFAPPIGKGRATRVDYTKGMVIEETDVPAGQFAQDWIDKGLAKVAQAASASEEPAREDGAAV